jgi:hypothetical protein
MSYIVITKELDTKDDQYSFADFDKDGFEKKQNIKLQDKPVSVTIQGGNLVLIYEEKKPTQKYKSYSVPG